MSSAALASPTDPTVRASVAPSLTALVPIDLARRGAQLRARAVQQATTLAQAGIAVVLAHNDRGSGNDESLKRELDRRALTGVHLRSERLYSGVPNGAALRNLGARTIATPLMLLLDADIHPDAELFATMAQAVASGKEAFAMAPCLYLTPRGTRRLRRDGSAEALVCSYFRFDRRHVLHLASPSSVTVLSCNDYRLLGGFDERYAGHGYEDFDFLLRLAMLHGAVAPDPMLLVDRPYRAPLLAEGFRAALGRLTLPRVLQRRFALHLHHPTATLDDYGRLRSANAGRFLAKFGDLTGAGAGGTSTPAAAPLVDEFFKQCARLDLMPEHFHALFDARPGHLHRGDRLARTVRNLLRKLVK